MSLFKNEVGRPSNEVLRKRKIIYTIGIIAIIGVLVGGAYCVKNYFFNGEIGGYSQNANAREEKFSLTAKTLDGKSYKSDTNTSSELKFQVVKNSNYTAKSYTWYKDGKQYKSCTGSTCTLLTNQISTYYVKVKATNNKTYSTNKIKVRIDGTPQINIDKYCGSVKCSYPTVYQKVSNNGAYWDVQYYKSSITLSVTTRFINPKSYTWYRFGKKYPVCQNSTKCIAEVSNGNGVSNFYVVVEDKNGKKYTSYTEYVGIDTTKYLITGFVDSKGVKATYNSKKDLYTIKMKAGRKVSVTLNHESRFENFMESADVVWYKLNTQTKKYVSYRKHWGGFYMNETGEYKIVVKFPNGITDTAFFKIVK